MTNDSVNAYTWDSENRLVAVEPLSPTNGGSKVVNTYDYMGRRASKEVQVYVNGSWSTQAGSSFIYDGWNLIAETQTSFLGPQPSTTYYTWGNDISGSAQGAGGIGGLIAIADDDGDDLACYDANGNLTQLVNSDTGASSADYRYDAFGNTLSATGAEAEDNPEGKHTVSDLELRTISMGATDKDMHRCFGIFRIKFTGEICAGRRKSTVGFDGKFDIDDRYDWQDLEGESVRIRGVTIYDSYGALVADAGYAQPHDVLGSQTNSFEADASGHIPDPDRRFP